jgi:predicted RNase H-like nuclease (RuvC/YqgF family)
MIYNDEEAKKYGLPTKEDITKAAGSFRQELDEIHDRLLRQNCSNETHHNILSMESLRNCDEQFHKLIQENADLKKEIEWLKAEVKRFEKEHPCCAYAEGEERG